MTFRRIAIAQEMAQQLLQPSFLDTSLRSGLFLSGQSSGFGSRRHSEVSE
jgi:hypothetical protein